jgi:folate-binding protein YgfZ
MTAPIALETGSAALRLSGRDALVVLHRISTQRLDDLAPGCARTTLFCDFRGRLLHRATVAVTMDGAVWLLRDDAPGASLAAFVDRGIFREDVRIEDRSAELPVQLALDAREPNERIEGGAVPARVPESEGLALVVGGGASPGERVGEADRIARGHARHGHEIDEAFTPYEVNLAAHVHLDKGCYPGQESLQRLVTYESVRRRLVRFDGRGEAPVLQDVKAVDAVAGKLTSVAATVSGWSALAVVKINALDATFSLADGTALTAPNVFPMARPLGRG